MFPGMASGRICVCVGFAALAVENNTISHCCNLVWIRWSELMLSSGLVHGPSRAPLFHEGYLVTASLGEITFNVAPTQ